MTEIDRKFIERKFERLNHYLNKLETVKRLDEATYVADDHEYAYAEHYLQLAIEGILDICRHLVISLGLPTPDDSHGLFPTLQKAGILTEDFVKRNLKMPGFRNRLVHEYDEIDHGLTYQYLQKHIPDLKVFIDQISQFLLKQK